MADSARNLIVLSDGTGNSAAKQNKTNVWRLYEAINLRDGRSQVVVFGDGVGTSSIRILRVLGLAVGLGVKRNVLNLYKFLCRNYNTGDHMDDRIWAFGFSRGAFTIRVLVGLIYHEGLVSFHSEAELDRNAFAAYRAYRKKAFPARMPSKLWVAPGRYLRDRLISAWNVMTGARPYAEPKKKTVRVETAKKKDDTVWEEIVKLRRKSINVHFVGVWDTVGAYGLPIDELTQAVDKWVWPMKFRDEILCPNVQHARHALSLDDARKTFFPIPWNETAEQHLVAKGEVKPGRLWQVWFAGTHADVGGGYPDDGLSYVPLGWMIEEAREKGLVFEPLVVEKFAALATPAGRIYDSRSGFGALYRYQPRNAQLLLNPPRVKPPRDAQSPLDKDITPVVHGSVMIRMACGNDGYAPISLPEKIDVLPPYGPPVAFDAAAVRQALAQANQAAKSLSRDSDLEQQRRVEQQRHVLTDTQQLVAAASAQPKRTDLFQLVLDTVWWRRLTYFVWLAFVVIAVAYPLLAQYLRIEGVTDYLNDVQGGAVGWTLGLIKGFLPGYAEPWLNAVVRNVPGAVFVLLGLYVSLRFSAVLQGRICDRARAAWNVGGALDRLVPTGQRHALAKATLVFIGLAIAARFLSDGPWLFGISAAGAVGFFLWWALLMHRGPAGRVDPAKPGFFLGFARSMQTTKWTGGLYKCLAQTLAPGGFLALSGILAVFLAHRAVFDLLSAGGHYCMATPEVKKAPHEKEILGADKPFETSSVCRATGLRLIAGRKYRIQLDMDKGVGPKEGEGDWFDKGTRTDVAGFPADSIRHYMASPLKRWWWQNWFQPIARIGEVGNYEHVLQPAAPLPVVHFDCPKKKRLAGWKVWWEAIKGIPDAIKGIPDAIKGIPEAIEGIPEAIRDTPSPATPEFKQKQLDCEASEGIPPPNRTLISDITADATGELFLYVNDAMWAFPGPMDAKVFYKNNSGTAKVTVKRILAEPIIDPATAPANGQLVAR
jgi:uncharacterized protein (DUF2235 family)